jgi:acyl transferase domain-containing protein
LSDTSELDIAIIGMSTLLPGAPDTRAFWRNLVDGKCALAELSAAELEAAGVEPDEFRRPDYVRVGAKLDGIEYFDHEFFGISNREARLIDPQHRLLLQLGWKAFEDAGYDLSRFAGRVGVYAGVALNTYLTQALLGAADVDLGRDGQAVILGNAADYATSRLSYLFNLRGPSMTIQTACSTALVAVHEACQGLLSFQADMALAGGCSITLPNPRGYVYEKDSFFSPDGYVRAFDARAAGTVFSSGVALVVLKRRADAERDGDFIYALIKGSAVNNDGSDKVGYVAPSVHGQSQVIQDALSIAGIAPDTIGYVEAHGTGTELGDMVEIRALTEAWRVSTERKQFCAIGSVKTNIGHTDVAAGAVGLIKTALALQQRVLPASLGFETPNPRLALESSPFFVNARTRAWDTSGEKRRAAVSSFGIGGTNAHAILEEPDARAPRPRTRPRYCLTLSARTVESLRAQVADFGAFLANTSLDPADICYTTNVGRKAFKYRHVVMADDLVSLRDGLERIPVSDAAARELALTVEVDAAGAVDLAPSDLIELLRAAGIDARIPDAGAADGCRVIVKRDSVWLDDGITRLFVGAPSDRQRLVPTIAGHAWRVGVAVDWERFHAREPRWRVPLPTYAFVRSRHWVDVRGLRRAAEPAGVKNPDIGQWFYRPVWQETAPAIRPEPALRGAVVLLVARAAPSAALMEALAGARVIHVRTGAAFCRDAADRYVVALDDEHSYVELADALAAAGTMPRYVLHTLLVDDEPWAQDGSGFAATQALGLHSVVFLLRQLAARLGDDDTLSVAVAASNFTDVLGGERSNPDKATVLGATRTFPSEYSAIDCRIVDIPWLALERDVGAARLLVAELREQVAPHNELVAIRGRRRWQQTFAKVQVPAACASPVRAQGAYVILGGLGELGLSLSRYLAERVPSSLVLINSSKFVPRAEWDAWVATHGESHAWSRKIAALRALEQLGASVHIVQCDVADGERLHQTLAAITAEHGTLNAIIHAAGVVENGMIAHKDVARFADVFRAKVRGTYHLLEYATQHSCPKIILCSSMNALVGGLGQIDNTAANAFVDAIATSELAAKAGQVCSINWGAINSARLAEPVVLPQFEDLSREHKKNHMSDDEIRQVYDRILSWSFGPRLVVSTIDFGVVLKRWGDVARVTELGRLRRVAKAIGERESATAPAQEYRSSLHRFVVEAWSGILGVERLEWDDNLIARGAHSLAAVQFSSMLKESLDLRLHAMGLYEFPQVGAMVEYLQGLLDEKQAKTAQSREAK